MQTFLPTPDFYESAQVLDRQRLGKQRVETLQILNALHDPSYGWQNHPATTMWRGHEGSLVAYGLDVCRAWTDRGYKDTCADKIRAFMTEVQTPPSWLGDEEVHRSHRSNLLRKAPDYYRQFWPTDPDDLEYVWPVPEQIGM